MRRLSLATFVLVPLLTACATEGDSFDDVEAIAAAKVEMCHFNNGQGEYALVEVAENAVESHVAHGDTLFADDQDCDGEADTTPLPWTCGEFSESELDAFLDMVGQDGGAEGPYGEPSIEVILQDTNVTLVDCTPSGSSTSVYNGDYRIQRAQLSSSAGGRLAGANYSFGAYVIDTDFTITYTGGQASYGEQTQYYWDEGTWNDGAGTAGGYNNTVILYGDVGPDISDCVTDLAVWAEARGVSVYESNPTWDCP